LKLTILVTTQSQNHKNDDLQINR